MTAGCNDPCPCGSGAHYGRCCLDRELELERIVGEIEDTVRSLASDTWRSDPEWCRERVAEFYEGGMAAFGPQGPGDEELFDAHLWFLLDCPLPEGVTPLWSLRQRIASRAVELLARSELRAWRIESLGQTGLIGACCPLSGGRARLEIVRALHGEPRPGAVLVARSVPLGPERWALLGHGRVVDQSVAAEFDALLCSLDAPRGETWRVHGGVVARAARARRQTAGACGSSGGNVDAGAVTPFGRAA